MEVCATAIASARASLVGGADLATCVAPRSSELPATAPSATAALFPYILLQWSDIRAPYEMRFGIRGMNAPPARMVPASGWIGEHATERGRWSQFDQHQVEALAG